jgi:acyl transferase domain-containing protein/aryl carrier-like protein
MTQGSKTIDYRDLLKQAYLTIDGLNRKVARLERQNSEPIAVVGMACRFPGGCITPEAYWQFLREGRDGITEIPRSRWNIDQYYDPDPDAPGKMYSRWGGFLDHVDRFDPSFFNITPREAMSMDPQQRLLLEVAWEALEHAGCAPGKLVGSLTGVYVGICGGDYAALMGSQLRVRELYSGTGSAFSIAAGRLSYFLGLQGPSLAIDTACSSSLVSVHLAAQALRQRECDLALAGGVNLILSPEATIIFCKGRMLSFDRYCKTFDAAADGYVRGEGCGMVLLKRLSDAQADGDRILALISGSAVNQDGRSSGLTAPNGVAQEAVLRAALRNAGILPEQVGYVEAHGTGTALGDPIEMRALNAAMRAGHSQTNPLWAGSVKTNFGHTEAAAGIASLMKAILACHHREIPAHLHLSNPSPHIHWDSISIRVPRQTMPWPPEAALPIAGVSSFGFSGTNAHVIVQAPPPLKTPPTEAERPLHVLTLSARSAPGIQELAQRYKAHLESHPEDLIGDICFTAGAGRAHFEQRMAVVAHSAQLLADDLDRFFRGEASGDVYQGQTPAGSREPKLGFLFTGQGSQYSGMGRSLYETQPTFRQNLESCDELLRPSLQRSIIELLYTEGWDEDGGTLDQTHIAQPLLFALEYALAQMWQSWGVKPSVVMGHSLGEYVAACVAGVFGLEEGLRLVAERGRLMQKLPANGTMAALFVDESRVSDVIADYPETISIAALNGPANTVISGLTADVDKVLRTFEDRGVKAQNLRVSHAFHSPLMDPMLDEFESLLSTVTFSRPRIGMISNLTGKAAPGDEMTDPGRWRRHARQPVRFVDSVQTLAAQGVELFLEVGPHPVLSTLGPQCLGQAAMHWLPSLRRGRSDWQQLLASLAQLYVHGVKVDWSSFENGFYRRKIALPTYPFQRKRYWIVGDSLPAAVESDAPQTSRVEIDNLLYAVEWIPQELAIQGPPKHLKPDTLWVILADRTGVGEAYAKTIGDAGGIAALVFCGESFTQTGPERFAINPYAKEDYARLLDALSASAVAAIEIVHLWSLDAPVTGETDEEDLAQFRLPCGSVLHILQSLYALGKLESTHLWIATGGAQSTPPARPGTIAQRALWGLGRTLNLEHPGFLQRLMDVTVTDPAAASGQLSNEIHSDARDFQVRYAGHVRQVARLKRLPSPVGSPPMIQSGETYLVTGGLGALGLEVAEWLADHGARHLVLVGRSKPSEAAQSRIRSLEKAGCKVVIRQMDVTDKASVNRLLADIHRTTAPLTGIFHAAGVLDDGILLNQDWSRFEKVLAPRALGAWNLHRATRNLELRFFVLFSSAVSVFGSAGQANYAAANAYLDALAQYRTNAGLPGLSIAWGPWLKSGMAAGISNGRNARLAMTGFEMIPPEVGQRALTLALGQGEPQVCAASVDWEKFGAQLRPADDNLFFSTLVGNLVSRQIIDNSAPPKRLWLARWQERPDHQSQLFLQSYLGSQLARIVGLDAASLSPEKSLIDYGVDSLMLNELSNLIRQDFGFSLHLREVYANPTIAQLSVYIETGLRREPQPVPHLEQQPSDVTDAFLFGPPGKKLFGCYHAPNPKAVRETALVLCYPMGQEYIKAHTTYVQLANQLSAVGFPSIRFDYYGTGDSAGSCIQSSISQCKRDIALAIEELHKRSGKRKIGLVGLRVGATLAAMIAKERDDVESIILWEPVVRGDRYLEELNTLHKHMLKYSYVDEKLSSADEILGFSRNEALWKELSEIDIKNFFPSLSKHILLLRSDANSKMEEFKAFLEKSGTPHSYHEISSPRVWTEEVYKQLVPSSLLETAVRWASMVNS